MIKLISPSSVKSNQLVSQNIYRPWLIVRILGSNKPYTVARFANRQDADDHLRFLRRFIPSGAFAIIFELPQEE